MLKIAENTFTDNYFWLLQNLNSRTKLELISKLSDSLLQNDKSRQEKMLNCFGSFDCEESAEELIAEIRGARYFTKKDIKL